MEVGSSFSSSPLVFSIVALLLSHVINISCEAISMMDAMMQQDSKSEKFTHIFSYQTGAVTTLPPLQESRPEILGLNEVGGVFLTKTSLAFPSCFFVSTVRPQVFGKT